MIDPKLTLNEAIDALTIFLHAKQLEVFGDPELRIHRGYPDQGLPTYRGAKRVGKLIALVDTLNAQKDK